ncbi:MAG: Fe(3+) ABC transporter substrate-binding protein [Polyangiales bacterium]
MYHPRRILLAVCVAAVAFGAAWAQDDVVNVYSARHYDTDEDLYQRFTELTGIEVNVIEGDSDELISRITSEGENSPADVFITVDAGRLWRAEQEGLLSAVDSPVLDARVPENLRHPDSLWFGLTQRARGIVYATDRVEEGAISSYEQLAEPEWEGRVCIRSSSNIYNQSLLASLIATAGADAAESWAAGVVENMARPPQGGDTDQIRAVAAGECDVAVANHYYLARLIASDDPDDAEVAEQVEWVFPNQDGRGAHVNVSGAGVLETAPNRAHAVLFVEYLTTPAAQEVFAGGNFEFPAVPNVDLAEVTAGFGEFESDAVNVAEYGVNNPEAVRIFDRVGWR